mmetsp:Transcript_20358/g.26298  ORF Transcript_20358/g.26298 Transcript_20358/m.26298 type:complete len:344 (-) Transcript_20358:103-1134(-)
MRTPVFLFFNAILVFFAIIAVFAQVEDTSIGKTTVQQLNREELLSEYVEEERQELSAELHLHPEVDWDEYIDKDQYTYVPPEDYEFVVNLIIDPCRDYDADCCWDKFGVPEYADFIPENFDSSGSVVTYDEDSEEIDSSESRLPDQYIIYDEECREDDEGEAYRIVETIPCGDDEKNTTLDYEDPYCLGDYKSRDESIILPPCWDNNASIDATATCSTLDGTIFQNCVAFGYSSSAYIVQCGNDFVEDNHCGTFIELHFPDDETILSQTRLEGGFTNGHRTSIMPLIYQGDSTKIICQGDYELWWVQRTLYDFRIQLKKKFYVSTPGCSFDTFADVYYPYYTS